VPIPETPARDHRFARRAVVMVLFATLLISCTDNGRSKAAAGPCLLSPEEVSAIVHTTVDLGAVSSGMLPQPGLALCTYPTNASFGAITLAVQRPGQVAFQRAQDEARSNHAMSPSFATIVGLGDAAYSIGDSVHVLQGDAYLSVGMQYPADADFTIVQQLTKQALLHVG
jgi:hypothetical protein